MEYVISNSRLKVAISSKGAELQSIMDQEGNEYLWQGSRSSWEDKAPNIFPYIGRLTEETYTINGKPYHMGIHGFAMHKEFLAKQKTDESAALYVEDDEETRKQYPFPFRFYVEYALSGSRIEITYRVLNQGNETMYFGVGGHPGFNVPFEAGCRFEDYTIEFEEHAEPVRIGMSEKCFVQGPDRNLPLREGRYLDLQHGLFDEDAILLKNMGKRVVLKRRNGKNAIAVSFPDMSYLGIWHWPKASVDYVCIEPWSSLPSRQDVVEDITKQDNLISLEPGKSYENKWEIELIRGNDCN